MPVKLFVRKLIGFFRKIGDWAEETQKIYPEAAEEEEETREIHSIWDYLTFKENTQSYHLVNVVGFDEWTDMGEIRRRIKELFGIDYKHEKSLYPYIKTLTDIGLFETTDVGGRRKWRKKDLFIKAKASEKKGEKVKITAKKKEKN